MFLTIFSPFWGHFDPFWPKMAIWAQNGHFGSEGPFWALGDQTDQWGAHLGSFWGQKSKKFKILKIS